MSLFHNQPTRTPKRSSWRAVRQMESRDLHRTALHLRRQEVELGALSEGQEWFWDQLVAELEWRSSRRRRGYTRCFCELCR